MARPPELSAATYRQMASVMKARGKKTRENYFLGRASQAFENPLPARNTGKISTVPLPEWGGKGKRWDYGAGGASYSLFTGKRNPGDSSDRGITPGGKSTPAAPGPGRITRGPGNANPPPPAPVTGRVGGPTRAVSSSSRATTDSLRKRTQLGTGSRGAGAPFAPVARALGAQLRGTQRRR